MLRKKPGGRPTPDGNREDKMGFLKGWTPQLLSIFRIVVALLFLEAGGGPQEPVARVRQ